MLQHGWLNYGSIMQSEIKSQIQKDKYSIYCMESTHMRYLEEANSLKKSRIEFTKNWGNGRMGILSFCLG